MNPPTALDTGRPPETKESEGEKFLNPRKSPAQGHRHGNSRGMTIAMILGASAFMVCIGLIAFGGTSSDSEPGSVAPVSASNPPGESESEAAQAEPPATETLVEETTTTEADATTQVSNEAGPADSSTEESPATETGDTQEPQEARPEADAEAAPARAETPVLPDPNSPPVPPGAPEQYSVLSGGKIYLRGTLPDAEIGRQIVAAVEQVMGAGNVIGEYLIDANEPFDPNDPTPVFINDTITFASGSAEIAPDFYPLIATAPVLLAIQPTVVVTITGHTDSQGTDEANLALSQARVDAVRDWVISQGGDGERLIAIGKGEAEPVADNDTEEGRLANRRVEFLIEGFDFTLGG